jgi:hypothetical protein
MRNTAEVLIDQQGVYLAIGIDRSSEDMAHFVRLDFNSTMLLIGPKQAEMLANKLLGYAKQAALEPKP